MRTDKLIIAPILYYNYTIFNTISPIKLLVKVKFEFYYFDNLFNFTNFNFCTHFEMCLYYK